MGYGEYDVFELAHTNNYKKHNGKRAVKGVVVHVAEGTYDGTVSWFKNPNAKVSAHFVIAKDGRIAQCVELNDIAYANGTSGTPSSKYYWGLSEHPLIRHYKNNANDYTVSIELEGKSTDPEPVADKQWHSVIRVVRDVLQEYDLKASYIHILQHRDIAPTRKANCPHPLFPLDALIREVDLIMGYELEGVDEMYEGDNDENVQG